MSNWNQQTAPKILSLQEVEAEMFKQRNQRILDLKKLDLNEPTKPTLLEPTKSTLLESTKPTLLEPTKSTLSSSTPTPPPKSTLKVQKPSSAPRKSIDSKQRPNYKLSSIMTQYEKEVIAKIQIAQLVTQDPFADDFYYKVYSLEPMTPETPKQISFFKNDEEKLLNTKNIQSQVQKLIDGRKKIGKPKSLNRLYI